jgi:hypothetical protein
MYSGVVNDGVQGRIGINVSGGIIIGTGTFEFDMIPATAGGNFVEYGSPTVSGSITAGGTISLTLTGLSGTMGSFPSLIDEAWNIDDFNGVTGAGTNFVPNPPTSNTTYDSFSTGTATNSTGSINGAAYDGSTAILVKGGRFGSVWGGFFGADYFEVWNVRFLAVSPISMTIAIPGGPTQECTDVGSSTIFMNAQVTVFDPDDVVETISWKLDGSPVASGESVEILVPLGTHSVEATVNTVLGKSATDTESIVVEDTIAPVVSTAFINKKTGAEITTIKSKEKAGISYSISDVCDPVPTIINATAGIPAENGGTVAAKVKDSSVGISVQGNGDNVELTVTAEDDLGNMSSSKALLTIIP